MDKHFESTRCLLCHDAPCSAACNKGQDPARGIRALRFENDRVVGSFLSSKACADCDAPCEKACIHPDFPIRIKQISKGIENKQVKELPSLAIDFCGVHCENPFSWVHQLLPVTMR